MITVASVGAARETVGHLGRPGQSVVRAPHGGDEVVHTEGRHEFLGVVRRDDADVDAHAALEGDALLVAAQIGRVGVLGRAVLGAYGFGYPVGRSIRPSK